MGGLLGGGGAKGMLPPSQIIGGGAWPSLPPPTPMYIIMGQESLTQVPNKTGPGSQREIFLNIYFHETRI